MFLRYATSSHFATLSRALATTSEIRYAFAMKSSSAAQILDFSKASLRERLGGQLRSLRLARGWSLADATLHTGIPRSTLSRIENGKLSLNYEKLVSLSQGFGVDLSALFGGEAAEPATPPAPGRRSVNRLGTGDSIELPFSTDTYLATDLMQKVMSPIVCEATARTVEEAGPWLNHAGEEFVYVLSGELELHTRIYAPLKLKPGETVYFDSGVDHRYVSIGAGPCRFLSVCVDAQPAKNSA